MTTVRSRFQATMLLLIGLILLWFMTMVFQAGAGEGPDRGNTVQVPLFLLVLSAPLWSPLLRRRMKWPPVYLLVTQLGLYVVYETGISIETNIRSDVLLIYPAILLNAWILFRSPAQIDPAQIDPARTRRSTWLKVVGVVGIIVGIIGFLGSLVFFATPLIVQSGKEWVEQIEANPDPHLYTSEMIKNLRDRYSVPSWFTPYCLSMGLLGLVASSLYLWGAFRLFQLKKTGPALFVRGAFSYMLVSAIIVTTGLISKSTAIQDNLFIALSLLMINGCLILVVRTRGSDSGWLKWSSESSGRSNAG